MRFSLALVALAACFAVSYATIGVDVSQLYGVSAWQCLKKNGYKFAIVRCYCSTGNPDKNCAQSVANAWSGGMEHVDIYMFPCPQCGNAKGQVQALWNHAKNIKYGQMWLDIEGSEYWLGSTSKNRAFMNDLANAAKEIFGSKLGGIYTNKHQWDTLMGSWNAWSSLRLWWCYWDNSASWSSWSSFGGWTKPAIKQYTGTSSVCGMGVDHDYY